MATLKITQVRSRIGATAQQCKNLDALGLHKINQSATHSDSAIIKGMIERVKHLVNVEVTEEKAAKKAAPKAAKAAAETVVAEPTEQATAPTAEKAPKAEKAEKKPAAKKPAAKKVTKTKKEE